MNICGNAWPVKYILSAKCKQFSQVQSLGTLKVMPRKTDTLRKTDALTTITRNRREHQNNIQCIVYTLSVVESETQPRFHYGKQ